MAIGSAYSLLVQARLDDKLLQAELDSVTKTASGEYKINLQAQLDTAKLQDQLQAMQARIQDQISSQMLSVNKYLLGAEGGTPTADAAIASAQQYQTVLQSLQGIPYVSPEQQAQIKEAYTNWQLNKAAVTENTSVLGEFGQALETSFKYTLTYGLAVQTIFGTFQSIKDGVQYVKDLNDAMTQTRMITGQTSDQVTKLYGNYQQMASQLGVTTLEVSKASDTWLRQGKSAQDAAQLTQATIEMSKLAATDQTTAAENLTAIMNGFKMQAGDATSVMDKMLALTNSTKTTAAVSFQDISAAMQASASTASEAGVSYDQLASYIATIGTVTQASGDTVGNALKTMFSRFEQVKAGATEGADSLNNVDKVLHTVGLSVTDANGNFIDLGTIIDELGKKWNTLDTFQKNQLATAVAGARQYNSFIALMDNYNNALDYQKAELESTGLSTQRYGSYLDSVAASAAKAQTAWQGLWSDTINSAGIKFFYDLSAGIATTIDKIGGLETVLEIAIPLILAFNAAWVKTIGINILGFLSQLVAGISSLDVLLPAMTSGMETVTVVNGEVATSFDLVAISEAGATLGITLLIAGLVKLGEALDKEKQANADFDKQQQDTIDTIYKSATSYQEYHDKVVAALDQQGIKLNNLGQAYEVVAGNQIRYLNGIKVLTDAQYEAARSSEQLAAYEDLAARHLNDQATSAENAVPQLQALDTTLKSLQDSNKTLDDIITKSQGNKLTFDDIQKLLALSPDYANALTIEGDKVSVNTDLLRQYQVAQADKAVADAKAAGATDIQIKVLQAYSDQLKTAVAESKTYTDTFTAMIASTMNQMTAQQALSGGFQKLSAGLDQINNEFKSGQISASSYFQSLNSQLKSVDFSKMFAQNKDAAQVFFAGLSLNAMQALGQINAAFKAGDIDVNEYTKALEEITKTFQFLGGVVRDFGSSMGMTSSQISQITSSLSGMANAAGQLAGMQQLNVDLEGALADQAKGTLDKTSQSYTDAMMQIANAAAASGQTFTDMQGNALVGAQNIYNYITANAANFNAFANQAANKTGNLTQTILQDIGSMLETLGSSISNFKAQITMTPNIQWGSIPVLGMNLPIPTNVTFTLGATSTLSMGDIGKAISGFGQQLQATSLNWDSSIYTLPQTMNQISGTAGNAANSIKDIGSALTKAAGGAKDLTSQLDKMKTAAEDALNAQLAGYKAIIDAQKQMIDNTLQQRTYEEDIANQNQSIAQIKNRLLAIQFDTSDAANAERLTLTDELNKAQQKLSDTEAKQSADVQKAALDADYAAFEARIKTAVDAIKALNATSVSQLATQISQILASIGNAPAIKPQTTATIQTFHSGMEVGYAGEVGGDEVFAKLMKGEAVITPAEISTFMNKTLPQITSSAAMNSGVTFAKLFDLNVQGNLDSSVMPDLEKLSNDIVNRINQTLTGRGYVRQTQITGVV